MTEPGLNHLTAPRDVTFDFHFYLAEKWLDFDDGRCLDSVLMYAAMEMRCAIERYLFELLLLLKGHKLSTKEEKVCQSRRGTLELFKIAEPNYRKRVEFTNIIASLERGVPKVGTIDRKYLDRSWEKLSDYCHKQLRPDMSFSSPDRSFQRKGFELLQELRQKFRGWHSEHAFGVINLSSIPEEVSDIYARFVKGDLRTSEVKRMLQIAGPVLAMRNRLKA